MESNLQNKVIKDLLLMLSNNTLIQVEINTLLNGISKNPVLHSEERMLYGSYCNVDFFFMVKTQNSRNSEES